MMENIPQEIFINGEYKIIDLNGVKLLVFKSGTIYRWFCNKYWKLVRNTINHSCGYNRILINSNMISRHRIMCFTFKNLDINNKARQIDHIDGNRINNKLDNLRIVSNQENCMNQTRAKGYTYNKNIKKWQAYIRFNKLIHLGLFKTEEDAHNAYLNAKKKYHVIQQSIEELEAEFETLINI